MIVGFGFYPEGWCSFMPLEAGSVIERVLDLRRIWGGNGADLFTGFSPNDDDATLTSVVDNHMVGRLGKARAIDPRVSVISRWANGTSHDLQELADELQVSLRHLQRLTIDSYGLAPRHLANKHKIMRWQRHSRSKQWHRARIHGRRSISISRTSYGTSSATSV